MTIPKGSSQHHTLAAQLPTYQDPGLTIIKVLYKGQGRVTYCIGSWAVRDSTHLGLKGLAASLLWASVWTLMEPLGFCKWP